MADAAFDDITQVIVAEGGKLSETNPRRPATGIIGEKCSQASKELLCLADLMEQAVKNHVLLILHAAHIRTLRRFQ